MTKRAGVGSFELVEARREDAPVLESLLDAYLRELAAHRELPLGATDAAGYRSLEATWSEPGRHAFLFRAAGRIVGFALVREPGSGRWQMAEFYILPEHRRRGLGRRAVRSIWRRLPGAWELQVHRRNRVARAFWTACIEAEGRDIPRPREIRARDGRRLQLDFRVRPDDGRDHRGSERPGNPFVPGWVAGRYAEARPAIHARMLAAIRSALPAELPVPRALDVGCGTGLSTTVLLAYAREVVGIDPVPGMFRQARSDAAIRYAAARVEELPFRSASFELATLGCVFHWCDPTALFHELGRVLQPQGVLVIYDNGFFGEMRELPSAKRWFSTVHPKLFPAPARGAPFRPECAPAGFLPEARVFVDEWIAFDLDALVRYLTSQSNVIAAVQSGATTLPDAEQLLRRELEPLFREAGTSRAHFRFGGFICALRHAGPQVGASAAR